MSAFKCPTCSNRLRKGWLFCSECSKYYSETDLLRYCKKFGYKDEEEVKSYIREIKTNNNIKLLFINQNNNKPFIIKWFAKFVRLFMK